MSLDHPQVNRQIEVTNCTLLKLIKAQLKGVMGARPEELPWVLWAYQTTARTPTGETLFKLPFDEEAVIPVKVRLSSLRRAHYDESSNNEELRLNLDCLSKVRDKAALRMA